MKPLLSLLISATFFVPLLGHTESEALRIIRVQGRNEATVTTPTVRLGDVADVTSLDMQHDEAVIGLKKVFLANSPEPGKEDTLSADMIIDQMKNAGVDMRRVGYALPRVVTIKRAGRVIGLEEIRHALLSVIADSGKDVALRDIRYDEPIVVPPGATQVRAEAGIHGRPGVMAFRLGVEVDGQLAANRTIEAGIDEWGDVPVARRALQKGEVVQDADLVRARYNLALLPRDALRSENQIVGLETKRDLQIGEPVRRDVLAIPPVVTVGSKVTMMYRNGVFELTATGTALESGIRGQDIRIRNEASKKIVVGTVMEPGLVGIKP
ncbi:MAG: flagellar basal body P-ring formation chaperone FlgA [Oligoflexia bacterium]|nr:flagellar basal body P-ring formation chaperone FlgA [Oligoflexia bacterium]